MVNVSTLGQYLTQISQLKTQQTSFADLSLQLSSGKKTQKLSGLGTDVIRAMRSRAGIDSLTVYSDNITNANRRINLMTTATREIKAQTENVIAGLTLAVQEGDFPDLESTQDLAKSVYEFVIDLINQTDGERYLFGGADTTEPPLTDKGLFTSALGNFLPDSSDLTNPPLVATGIIGDWGDGTITTDQFIAAYDAASDTVLGFSNALTSNTAGKTTVQVSDASSFDYTKLANNTSMKEIIRALGVLKQLPPVEYAPGALNDPTATTLAGDVAPFPPREKQDNFFQVINDLIGKLNKAVDDLDQLEFSLAQVQGQITIVKESYRDQIKSFQDIVGEIEDADITEVSVKIKQLEIQIQASFQVTSLASQLTLAAFLN